MREGLIDQRIWRDDRRWGGSETLESCEEEEKIRDWEGRRRNRSDNGGMGGGIDQRMEGWEEEEGWIREWRDDETNNR